MLMLMHVLFSIFKLNGLYITFSFVGNPIKLFGIPGKYVFSFLIMIYHCEMPRTHPLDPYNVTNV